MADEAAEPLLKKGADYGATEDETSREAETAKATAYALRTAATGLTSAEAAKRLEEFGENVLAEPERNELLHFLSFFWGPMPIMIWLATLVVCVEGDWEDVGVLLTLQVVNGSVGYYEERSAGDAIAALKKSLAPRASAKRDGAFLAIPARELVPGDVVNLKLGDIVPADCRLLKGPSLEVDQAALTGESLPVTRAETDTVFMGSVIRRGEVEAVVVFTGGRTFFGRAAEMVNKAAGEQQGRFAKVMFQNTLVLFSLSVTLCTIIYVQLVRSGLTLFDALSVTIVILIACIPIAMQVVSTTVMAVGGRALAEKKAILARLSAIEELAGMNVLCSDKTGTLTQNKLQLFDPVLIDASRTPEDLVFLAALAAKRMASGADAIDTVVVAAVADKDRARFADYAELEFTPFDPVTKRTEARVSGPDGRELRVTKGATKVVLELCGDREAIRGRVMQANQDLADRGFRSIGVAVAKAGGDWTFVGVLSLFDPPRADTKETLEKARAMGIAVKMVTGDQTAIAVETSKAVGIAAEPTILDMKAFSAADAESVEAATALCERVDGFAEVYPEHKYRIVELLQGNGHTVGMTGDGVNDAPALQQASIGVAMGITGTEVAKQAADMVLMDDDFATIVAAVEEGRAIYKNMQAFVCFLLSCNFGEVATVFGATLLGVPDVLTPLQLLWVNLVTDGPPATALGFNPPDPDAMAKPPRDPAAPILTPWLLCRYALTGSYVGFATIQIFLDHFAAAGVPRRRLRAWASCDAATEAWADFAPATQAAAALDPCAAAFGASSPLKATAQTLSLSTLVAMEMLKALSAVSLDHSLLRVPPWRNRWLLAGVALPVGLHLGLLYTPGLRDLFGLAPLDAAQWATVAKFAAPILLVEEFTKAVGRHLDAKAAAARAAAKAKASGG